MMKTSLGTMFADTLDADSLDQIATWCETAADQLGVASKDYSVSSPTWSELIEDKRVYTNAAAALRTIAGFSRVVPAPPITDWIIVPTSHSESR